MVDVRINTLYKKDGNIRYYEEYSYDSPRSDDEDDLHVTELIIGKKLIESFDSSKSISFHSNCDIERLKSTFKKLSMLGANCKSILNNQILVEDDDTQIQIFSSAKIKIKEAQELFAFTHFASINLDEVDMTEIRDASRMFYCCRTQKLSLRNATMPQLTNANRMFEEFTGDVDLSHIYAPYVDTATDMFSECRVKSIVLNNLGNKALKNVYQMFYKCKAESIILNNICNKNLIKMNSMFAECKANLVDISNLDTHYVEQMALMFNDAHIKHINIKLDITNLQRADSMFAGCKTDEIDFSNTCFTNLICTAGMFEHSTINTINLSNTDFPNMIDMSYMFWDCNVINLNLNEFRVENSNDKLDSVACMFSRCNTELIDIRRIRLTKNTDTTDMFKECNANVLK